MLIKLAWQSLCHRKTTVLLTLFSIAVSVMIVLSIEHLRTETKTSFTRSLSGTDLIVGARAGRIHLLLYSVFRIGQATHNISWESYDKIRQLPGVSWTIPISLGDSHKGYRVLGTNEDYFKYFRYGQKQDLELQQGRAFSGIYETVLGAEVARKLGYKLGDDIIISHGISEVSFTLHDQYPFEVVGILAPTGTPVDQTVHISLEGLEAIHDPAQRPPSAAQDKSQFSPKQITAFLVGLDNRVMTFRLQRAINTYHREALMAILPGIALSELWQTMGLLEKVLALVASLIVAASLLGMTTIILASLQQRKKEIALLRAIGSPPWFIFVLIEAEVLLITLGGIALGFVLLWLGLVGAESLIAEHYGLVISTMPFSLSSLSYGGIILLTALLMALIPSVIAYKQSLHQGLNHSGH